MADASAYPSPKGLTRLQFPGYNHEQLMRIIHSRLEGVPRNIVDRDAIQYASRKVAAVSGDARRALDICRRAVEIAEEEARETQPESPSSSRQATGQDLRSQAKVTITTVQKAINEATSSPMQQYLRALPFASKMVLVAFLGRAKRSGRAESTFGELLDELDKAPLVRGGVLNHLIQEGTGTDGVRKRLSALGRASMDLQEAGILVLEGQKLDRPTKVRLGISSDDIRLAFRHDSEVNGTRICY